MKKGLLAVFVFVVVGAKAQYVTIPDSGFVSYLNWIFPQCMSGNLMDSTCSAIVNSTMVDCDNYHIPIKDLTGIQYFHNLKTLWCFGNELTSLPTLPKRLTDLECDLNGLSSLPILPDSLTILTCSTNQLSSLPVLTNGLTYLDCSNNHIGSLPALPNSLARLACTDNQLNTLPVLSNNLTELFCYNNQLNSLPVLPDSLYKCYIDSNPLTCLPELKRIDFFSFSNTQVTCLPNYGNVTSSTPALNTLPLCDSTNNTHGCQIFNSIEQIPTPQFSLSPNPATNSVSITTGAEEMGSTITITDITGRKVLTVPLPTANCQLPTDFSNGVYLLTLATPTGSSATKKLVISK